MVSFVFGLTATIARREFIAALGNVANLPEPLRRGD
jgi:hypothetical protein